MLFATSLILLLAPAVLGANDWSKACTSGSCSYESGDGQKTAWGTLVLNGDGNAISDITSAAGWEILNCDPKSAEAQDIRIVCKNPDAGCDHVFNGGAEHTIVRLPENCGAGPFARLSNTWIHEDQSLPEELQTKTKRWWHPKHPKRAAAPADHPVRGMSIDFNFGAIPATKGRVTFSVTGTNNPNQRTHPDDHKRELHSTVRHGSLELQKRGFFGSFVDKAKSVAKKVVAPVAAPIAKVVAPIQKVVAPIKKVAAKVAAPIKKVAAKVAAPVKKVAAKVAAPIKKVAAKVAAPIKKVAAKVAAPVKKVASKVVSAGKTAAKKVVSAGKTAAKKVASAEKTVEKDAKKAVGAVKDGAKKAVGAVESGAKKAVGAVETGAKKAVGAVETGAKKAAGAVESGAKKAVGAVEKGAEKVVDGAKKGAEKVVDGAKKAAGAVKDGAEKVVDGVEDGAKKAAGAVKEGAEKVVDGVEDGAKKVVDGAKKVVGAVEDGAKKAVGAVEDGAEKVIDGAKKVVDAAGNIVGDAADKIGDAADKVVDGAKKVVGAAGDAVGDAAEAVGDAVGDANNVDQKFEKDLSIFDVNRNFPILDQSISCPQKGKVPAFDAGVKVDVNVNANAHVTMGIAIKGTIVPPAIDDMAITAVLNGGAKATFNVHANAEGTFDTGSIKLFEAGIPGFDFPGIVSVGPTFSINADASITLGVTADMAVTAAWDLPEVSLVFPPSAGASNANASPAAAPVKLDVGASVDLTGKAEAHLIPRIDLGVNVLNGLGKATVFMDLDAFGVLDFNAKATFNADGDTTGKATSSSSFGGCLGLDAGLAITAGLDGSLGPLGGTKSFDLFRKQFDIFDKCFGDQKREILPPRDLTLSSRGLNLKCPGAKPGKNTKAVDATATP